MWLTYGLLIIMPMAANRIFPAMTTGRPSAPVGGPRPASAAGASVLDFPGAAPAALSPAALAGAPALSLKLPIGCRA
jgi:hypothetical protein